MLRTITRIKSISPGQKIGCGHYYAAAFKYIRQLFQNPEVLETALEQVVADIE